MKKVLLTAVMAAAVASAASAQGISIGPRVGVNFAKVTMADGDSESKKFWNDEVKNNTGFVIGVATQFGITESFSIAPELNFSQQGYKLEFSEAEFDEETGEVYSFDVKRSFKANYLQLPVLARYSFGSDDVKFFVNAGPYASFWMSGKSKDEINASFMGINISDTEETDVEFDKEKDGADYNRLDFGLVGGIGVGFNAGPGMLTIDARYNMGLGNMINTEGDDKTKLANRFIGVGVSYMFGMGN